jgi:Uma2 family endonuclease
MAKTLRKPPPSMTVAEFLDWPGDGRGRKCQLIAGEVHVMSPGSAVHAIIQANLAYELRRYFLERKIRCRAGTEVGVISREGPNTVRVADVGVTLAPVPAGQRAWPEPLLLMEVLSPSNTSETWENVWSYRTVPSVQEIAVIHSTRVQAEVLRRGTDGQWPEALENIGEGETLSFACIGFACPLIDLYAETPFGRDDVA